MDRFLQYVLRSADEVGELPQRLLYVFGRDIIFWCNPVLVYYALDEIKTSRIMRFIIVVSVLAAPLDVTAFRTFVNLGVWLMVLGVPGLVNSKLGSRFIALFVVVWAAIFYTNLRAVW